MERTAVSCKTKSRKRQKKKTGHYGRRDNEEKIRSVSRKEAVYHACNMWINKRHHDVKTYYKQRTKHISNIWSYIGENYKMNSWK